MGSLLVGIESPSGLEDLTDGEINEDAHGKDNPASNLEGESASARVEAAGVSKDLQNVLAGDNVFQEEQPVENFTCLSNRQGAFSGFPLRRPLRFLLRLASHRSLPGVVSEQTQLTRRLRLTSTFNGIEFK
jgi:hypothetical protein